MSVFLPCYKSKMSIYLADNQYMSKEKI